MTRRNDTQQQQQKNAQSNQNDRSQQSRSTSPSRSQDDGGGRSGQGFAGMDPERQREIAAEGGRAAHQKGTAHEFSPEEAREAGRKGGQASGSNRSNAGNRDDDR